MLNSGGANCFTGSFGFQTTHQTAEKAAELLGVGAGDVLICSTGLIGTGDEVFRAKVLDGTEKGIAELQRRRRGSGIPRDHDDRLQAEALGRLAGRLDRSAAWRRAPGCWPPGSRRCSW